MRLLRLALRGFISYDDLDLDLTEVDIAAVVGDVGSGKSSLLTALTWCLWGVDDRRGESVINEDFDECRVRVEFVSRDEHWFVERTAHRSGRNSTLTFAKAGDESIVSDVAKLKSEHTIAETQAEINSKIGLTYDAIAAGPLMTQDNAGTFMDLKPAPRKELLIKLFGVEIYEAFRKRASAVGAEYAKEAERAEDSVRRLDETLADEDDAKAELRDARYNLVIAQNERQMIEVKLEAAREQQVALRERARLAQNLTQTVEMLSQRITSDKKEYTRLLRQISEAHQAVDAPEPTFEPLEDVSDDAIEAARIKYEAVRAEVDERRGLEPKWPLLQQQLDRATKMASIVETVPCGGEGIYATCRFLTGAPTKEEIEAQRQEIARIHDRLEQLAMPALAAKYEQRYNDLRSAQATVQREVIRREATTAQWRLKIDAAKLTAANGQDTLNRLEAQIRRDQSLLERSKDQLDNAKADQEQVAALEAEVESLRLSADEQRRSIEMVHQPAVARAEERIRTLEVARKERAEAMKAYVAAKGKAEVYVILTKAFHQDGIPTMILENGIPLIEERANEVLARMPETRVVRILTQREKKAGGKAGGMMERVDVVVERGGRRRGYGALSGGERFRVAFALRIAIGHTLAHRSGATIDTLILDEGWGSQDEKGVEALLESLAAVQSDFGLVLIITHLKAVSDRIQKQIQVARPEDGYSSVTLAA